MKTIDTVLQTKAGSGVWNWILQKKKTPHPALSPLKMNIFCVGDKKLLSSLFNQTF